MILLFMQRITDDTLVKGVCVCVCARVGGGSITTDPIIS